MRFQGNTVHSGSIVIMHNECILDVHYNYIVFTCMMIQTSVVDEVDRWESSRHKRTRDCDASDKHLSIGMNFCILCMSRLTQAPLW